LSDVDALFAAVSVRCNALRFVLSHFSHGWGHGAQRRWCTHAPTLRRGAYHKRAYYLSSHMTTWPLC
jgi:hypothetical protein